MASTPSYTPSVTCPVPLVRDLLRFSFALIKGEKKFTVHTETESALHQLTKLAPPNRTKYLEDSEEVCRAYTKAAKKGASAVPIAEDEVDHHYICFVTHSNRLYELDGDVDGPISRGSLAEGEDILTGSARYIIRQYTESKTDGTFGLLALVED